MKIYVVRVSGKYLKGGGCRYELVDDISNARTYSAKRYAKNSIRQTMEYELDENKIKQFENAEILECDMVIGGFQVDRLIFLIDMT